MKKYLLISLLLLLMLTGSVFAMGEQVQKSATNEDHSKMNMEQTATGNMKMENMDMKAKDHDMSSMGGMQGCH